MTSRARRLLTVAGRVSGTLIAGSALLVLGCPWLLSLALGAPAGSLMGRHVVKVVETALAEDEADERALIASVVDAWLAIQQ